MAVLSIVVAVGLTSVLLFLLFRGTTGPGEQLRTFYSTVNAGDCTAAYELLTPSLQEQLAGEAAFCTATQPVEGSLTMSDVTVASVLLEGDTGKIAAVTIEGDPRAATGGEGQTTVTWRMVKEGDAWLLEEFPRTWTALGLPGVPA